MKKTIEITHHKFTRWRLLLLVCTCMLSSLAQGEVILDGSVGPSGALPGPDYKVTENLGKRAGSNLFHSFGRFNLNASESATFSGSSGIKNVISRVTGGQSSNIDGTLRVSIPNANLYLLNPAGVIFGEHAKLDVPGSFHVSTADYLKFQDGVRFDSGDATTPQILATAAPEAFGFLGENPAGISLSGTTGSVLEVQQGSTLSLIGGDITSENTALYASGGQINIASVGSAGEVSFNESGIQTTLFGQMGDIFISQDSFVPRTVLGTGFIAGNIDASGDTAGRIFIRGGQMVMDNSFIASDTTNGNGGSIKIGLSGDLSLSAPERTLGGLFTGSEISSTTRGEGNAGSISLNVAGLNLTDRTRINTKAFDNTKGNAGNIAINAKNIHLQDKDGDPNRITQITTASFGEGDAGNIAITTDILEVLGEASIDSSTYSKGDGGDLTINADSLKVINGGSIDNISGKKATGKGGKLTIDADNLFLSGIHSTITTKVQGGGKPGNLAITADKLEVKNGAQILSSAGGQGNGGDMFVDSNKIILTNDEMALSDFGPFKEDAALILATGIHSDFFGQDGSTGSSGNVTIKSHNLIVSNGASITADNFVQGNSGKLFVESNQILLTNDPYVGKNRTGISAILGSLNKGESGDLTVKADNLVIKNGASIDTSNLGDGSSGNLVVEARSIILSGSDAEKRTRIINEALGESTGKLGDILVTTQKLNIKNGASISARTETFTNGGNIKIAADKISMHNNADITSSTKGRGDAGNITIKANNIVLSGQGSEISSEADIRTPEFRLERTGNITIAVGHMNILDGARISTADIDPSSSTLISDFDIQTKNSFNFNKGTSGNIDITLRDTLHLENKAIISTLKKKANAGNITINNGNILLLRDSSITTSVQNDKGNGGNISINTPIVALDSSNIIARAAEGKGGNITISGFLFKSPNSIVDASSELGIDGSIDFKPDTDISGSLAVLPDTFLNVSQQMSERCSARSENNLSSFVVKGRGGVPLSPGVLAPSNFLDYSHTEENSGQGSMNHHSSPDNDYRLPYSDSGKNIQFASSSINCSP